jgi:signal transduction histidine kinase
MRYKHSLRFRIAMSYFVTSVLLSAAVTGGVYLAYESLEDRFIAATLTAELDYFIEEFRANPALTPPVSTRLRGYVVREGESASLPAYLRGLGTGVSELSHDDRDYRVAVKDAGDMRFYLVYDDEEIEQREGYLLIFLVIGILLSSYLALWIGLWLSKKIIAPVTELVYKVTQLPRSDSSVRLATGYAADEVGMLASAFDDYTDRINAFIERERELTADTSHELRTPLAVISGAVELLLGEPGLPDKLEQRLLRIKRATREMTEIVAGLLLLAREADVSVLKLCSVEPLLREVIDNHLYLLRDKPVEIYVEVHAPLRVAVTPAILAVVLGNLIRNAFSYTTTGQVIVHLHADSLSITDTGMGISEASLPHIFERHFRSSIVTDIAGTGLGLSLVKRICDRYGWHIEIHSSAGTGTEVRLAFNGQVLS